MVVIEVRLPVKCNCVNKKRIILGIALLAVIAIAITGCSVYLRIFGKNVVRTGDLYVKTGEAFEVSMRSLDTFLEHRNDFLWVAEVKKIRALKPGKYRLSEGMSNNELVNLLRSGQQTPVKVSFNNQHTLQDLAGKVAHQIEADSSALMTVFKDSIFLSQKGINQAQMLGYFIPNTYEFFWNTSAEQFRDRMVKESDRFWNENRLKKAKVLQMTPHQVMALASIVHKETTKDSEHPRVAGLYINRIRRGIPLQADPTIIYILKQIHGWDFTVKRVLKKDLEITSPYNTYLNRGLPPSVIAMPDISAIDAVLNYERHNYLYMCADINNLGYHAFASTLKQHNRNAQKYQRWLNKQGIKR